VSGPKDASACGTRVEHQLARAWIEWLGQHAGILEQLYTFDTPDLPADRYSAAGLEAAECALHQRFPCVSDALLHHEVLDRFARYLGEVFVQSLDGCWVNDPFPGPSLRPAIRFPYNGIRLCVYEQVVLSLCFRTGRRWSAMHADLSQQCAMWWESGHDTL